MKTRTSRRKTEGGSGRYSQKWLEKAYLPLLASTGYIHLAQPTTEEGSRERLSKIDTQYAFAAAPGVSAYIQMNDLYDGTPVCLDLYITSGNVLQVRVNGVPYYYYYPAPSYVYGNMALWVYEFPGGGSAMYGYVNGLGLSKFPIPKFNEGFASPGPCSDNSMEPLPGDFFNAYFGMNNTSGWFMNAEVTQGPNNATTISAPFQSTGDFTETSLAPGNPTVGTDEKSAQF